MMIHRSKILHLAAGILLAWCLLLVSCKQPTATEAKAPSVARDISIPAFNRDSAYAFVEKQVSFGPRNLGSEGHRACLDWLVAKLQSFGLETQRQTFAAELYTNEVFPATNVLAYYRRDLSRRILLCAHWDTRHVAEKDADANMQDQPILGADDGASGVAVLLEIARVLQSEPVEIGIDFVFFDAEDQGSNNGAIESWCLGSQHWSKNLAPGNRPEYGILLDMVGSKGATFPKEAISLSYAGHIVDKVWPLASAMGYGHYFVNTRVQAITDDHLFVNRIARIPTIDIINYSRDSFGHYHHTHQDNMEIIDRTTLRAVGQVVLALLFKESVGAI